MELKAFRIHDYRCVTDSRLVEVTPLTVLVGKNESGKTSLLKALHKFKPYIPEPYNLDSDWPRGRRRDRESSKKVCITKFEFNDKELSEINDRMNTQFDYLSVELEINYAGKISVNSFDPDDLSNLYDPNDIKNLISNFPVLPETSNENLNEVFQKIKKQISELISAGEVSKFENEISDYISTLEKVISDGETQQVESEFIKTFEQSLTQIMNDFPKLTLPSKWVELYITKNLPTFIYMSDYRTFKGDAILDEVLKRKNENRLTEEDKTLLMMFNLSGLKLEEEVSKGNLDNREQRQYDLDDAAKTLTNLIAENFGIKKYEVEFRGDGQFFYTFIKDDKDPSLIKLEERSKGTQWFFSFDLMFMHESEGTFKGCIILLDEPGLHLHPGAQEKLLKRLEAYAEGNTLIYTTHLPFMINLQYPGRIRVLNETDTGTVVTENLSESQPEAKLVLQAALGMTGRSSYLLAKRNLVVEGVHDFWIIADLSRIFQISNNQGLEDDIFITATGGASEAVYIATFMIGQSLDVVVLLDSDNAGYVARDKLVKNWLTRYKDNKASVFNLGELVEEEGDFLIEDLFPEDFYIDHVKKTYEKVLRAYSIENISLNNTHGPIIKRIEKFFVDHQLRYNKGSVAKRIRTTLSKMNSTDDLPEVTLNYATKIFQKLFKAFPPFDESNQ